MYECLYCGNKFKHEPYYKAQEPKCSKCGDSNVRPIRESKKVNFYPETEEEAIPDGYLYGDSDW